MERFRRRLSASRQAAGRCFLQSDEALAHRLQQVIDLFFIILFNLLLTLVLSNKGHKFTKLCFEKNDN